MKSVASISSPSTPSYCEYYQAQLRKQDCWFVVAILKSFEHLSFDRTFDKDQSIFEFFVPVQSEPVFLRLMDYFQKEGMVITLEKKENRLINPQEQV